LDLDNGLEGLLDIKPTVFDMFQAFFRGHGCFEFSSHPGAGALGGTGWVCGHRVFESHQEKAMNGRR
jgi:hypothetical protein